MKNWRFWMVIRVWPIRYYNMFEQTLISLTIAVYIPLKVKIYSKSNYHELRTISIFLWYYFCLQQHSKILVLCSTIALTIQFSLVKFFILVIMLWFIDLNALPMSESLKIILAIKWKILFIDLWPCIFLFLFLILRKFLIPTSLLLCF